MSARGAEPGSEVLVVGAAVVGVRMLVEWRAFREGSSLLLPRHVRLRVALGGLVVGTVALIVAGTFIDWANPVVGLIYWGVCLLLTFAIAAVAYYDFKLVQLAGDQKLAELARERDRVLRDGLLALESDEDGGNGRLRRSRRSRADDAPGSP